MEYCSKCLYPNNHPLNITLNKEKICSGCLVHLEKDQLNWNYRFKKLKKIVNNYKSKNKKKFDCIVPISGGRDSHYILYVVKRLLKLNPIIVNYNIHYNTEIGIRNLSYLKTKMESPHLNLTLNPKTIKKITRYTLKQFGNIYWHCIAGQTVFPVQVACKMNIPLIIWGAHQGVDQVGMFSHLDEVEMTRKYRKEHDLFGYEAEDLLSNTSLKYDDIKNFSYPNDQEIYSKGIKGIYLNNYIRWDSKAQHELMILKYNFETNQLERTFDSYNHIDCLHYSNLHDYFKYLKFGYSLVNDHVAREIRLKRITKDEGKFLIKKYRNKNPKNIEYFIKWAGLDYRDLKYYFDKFRNTNIWEKNNNKWRLKTDLIDDDIDAKLEKISFIKKNRKSKKKLSSEQILFSKGFDD